MEQFALRTTGIYDVDRLWLTTANNPTVWIKMTALRSNMEDLFWQGRDGDSISPIMVIRDPSISPDDKKRITEANLAYPILVFKFSEGNYDVIDGLHRLSNAFMNEHAYIMARIITPEQLADSERLI